MLQLLVQLATIFSGVAAVARLSESVAQGQRRRTLKHQQKRAKILPREAADELEERYRGLRVKVGFDGDDDQYILVVTRATNVDYPRTFAGYDVIMDPRLTLRR